MRQTIMKVLGLACVATATVSCSDDFVPYNRLEGLRVLAVQSEPVSPAFGQTTTLTPLVFAPADETVTYAWSWCPIAGPSTQGAPCLVQEAQIAQILGAEAAAQLPPFNLGNEPTATFANNVPAAELQRLCDNKTPSGFSIFNCTNGFPIQIKMVATSSKAGVITDTVTTVRTLDLAFDPAAKPNTNPQISALTGQQLKKDSDDPEAPEAAPQSLTLDGAAVAFRQRDLRLRVVVPLESSEPSDDRNDLDQIVPSQERLFISWFVDSGTTEEPRTGFIAGKTSLEEATTTNWRPAIASKFPGAQSKVVAVIRDNRGGVAWTWGLVTLVEAPQ